MEKIVNKLFYMFLLSYFYVFGLQSHSSYTEDHQEKNYENYHNAKFIKVSSDYLSDEMVLAKFDCKIRGHLFYNSNSPLKIFADEIKKYCHSNSPHCLGIDISKRFITTPRVETFFKDLEEIKGKIVFVNLSETEVDYRITDVLKDLLSQNSFKYLNIANTNASKSKKTEKSLDEETKKKVIAISKDTVDFVNENQLSCERIENHKNYYSDFSKY